MVGMNKMSEKTLTMNNTVGELYATPVGHDTIAKVLLQMGIPEIIMTNRLLSKMKLGTAAKLAGKFIGPGLFDALLEMINSEDDRPAAGDGPIAEKWWKEAVFYQIYPRTFKDSNGDGIGDLQGIIQQLDYLKDLGVDALWLSPIYDSPNDDNGYDIRDYRKIMQEFGTMKDFDQLLAEIHKRDMRLIMDLVINHTSDEHEWFKQALADKDSKYRNYYFFRDGGEKEPNNWTSFFSGPAWNYYEEQDTWAMHLFSKKQMDLNWECEEMREELYDMINWWLDKGVDGFRMDVINYISKPEGLPDGDPGIGNMMGFTGIEKYYYGPRMHEFFHEIREKAFEPHQAFSVGETPGIGMKMGQLVTGEERKELDMIFSFDHLETPGHVRFDDYEYDLNYYRDYMIDWMENYGNNCWMSLFYNNHDNPRMVSKITSNKAHQEYICKLLAVMQFTLKGTPFIFQGDEMGLTNYPFTSMEEISDVEAKGYYQELLEKGKSPEEAFAIIKAGTREHCRILLPWNDFPADYRVQEKQMINEAVRKSYRELLKLRREDKALVYGDFTVLSRKKDRFVYERALGESSYIIDCNLCAKEKPAFDVTGYKLVYDNYRKATRKVLQPYETRIWKIK